MKLKVLIILLISNFAMAQNQATEAFLEKWDNSKNYLLEVAKAMPEDLYDYKPTKNKCLLANNWFI